MEKLILKFLIINDNAELIEQRLKKILQENEQYSSIFDLQVKGIKGSEFDIDIRQEITFHHYDIIILGYSFITNEEYLSKHRFFEKIKSGEIVYKQKNPNWSVFDKDMLEIFYEKRTGIESIILKEDGGNLPPSEDQVEELDLKPINKYIPPEENGGNLHPKEEADRKAQEEARKAKEEADRKAQEEVRKAKEEADRQAQEEARKAKEEADRQAEEEADRKAKEEADRKAKEEADRQAQEEARKAKEEADRKAKEEADRQAKEETLNDDGGNLPPIEEIGEFSEEEAKIFAIFKDEKNQKKEIPPKKIHKEKKEEQAEIKKDFTMTEEEILKILNPEKSEIETKSSKTTEKPFIHEKRMSIDIEENGGNLHPTEEHKTPEDTETIKQKTNVKKRGLGINLSKFPKREKNGGKLPPMEETEEQLKKGIEEPFYPEEEVLEEESSDKKKKAFTLPSFKLKNNSIKNGCNLPPREFKGDIGFFGNDRGVGTTFISFTLSKILSKNNTVAFIDMTERTYKKLETLKEKKMIDFDVYNSSNYIDAYRKNTDIKIFDFGEIDLNSESYFAEFERCNLKFLVGAEDDLKIFSMNKNYHYNEKNPDFYTVINFKEQNEERQLQKEYQGLNIITIPYLKENIDDVLKLIR